MNWRNLMFFLALACYVAATYHNMGYHHADEHYQIIEFAGSLLGTHTTQDLPWEYRDQIRPAIQPVLCGLVFKTLGLAQITDPYALAFSLRLITALLALLIIRNFIQQTESQINSMGAKKAYHALSYFLWFIPLIGVRFSSETWAGLFFLWALAVFYKKENSPGHFIQMGLLLGLSLLFRFQMIFAILPLWIWLGFVEKSRFGELMKMVLAFGLILALGILIDSWFYGQFVFSQWNYFYVNVVMDKASKFGAEPWYYYLVQMIQSPSYFIGIPILLALIMALALLRKEPLIWVLFSFLFFHSVTPHKELRFLFPLAFLVPFLLMSAWMKAAPWINRSWKLLLFHPLFILLTVVNALGLIAVLSKAAGIGNIAITHKLHQADEEANLICLTWANPYNPWESLPMKFYSNPQIKLQPIQELCQLDQQLSKKSSRNYLVLRQADLEKGRCLEQIQAHGFQPIMESVPAWILGLNVFYSGMDRSQVLFLYQQVGVAQPSVTH